MSGGHLLVNERDKTGLGFVLFDAGVPCLYGTRGDIQSKSPLHAEAEGLLWAAQEMLKLGHMDIHYESDIEQLVKLLQKRKTGHRWQWTLTK